MSPISQSWKKRVKACRDEESGAISLLNMYLVLTLAILGGIGIDMANLISARNHLQVAADVAAHAAMAAYKDGDTPAEARQKALQYAQANMPSGGYGTVLQADDIHFGAYYRTTQEFQKNDDWDEAAMVVTSRLSETANPVSSLLLRLVGFNDFDVRTEAVFINGDPPCVGDGFYASGRVDMQSNNTFTDGFCIRSSSVVEFNNGNTFQSDPTLEFPVLVSMPTLNDLTIPSSGWGSNPGLYDARRDGVHDLNVDTFITDVIAGMYGAEKDSSKNPHTRLYITDPEDVKYITVIGAPKGKGKKTTAPISPTNCTTFHPDCLYPNAINVVDCGGTTLDISADLYENVVIHTTCELDFANGADIRNSTIITDSTSDRSIATNSSGFSLGNMTTCGGNGGATIITRGSMRFAAKMQLLGGQIIAAGDLNFAAQAVGHVGASVITGGEIDGTSLANFQGCPGSVLHAFGSNVDWPARMAY